MLTSKIESILFISNKPIKIKELAKRCGRSKDEVEVAIEDLKNKYNQDSGINILIVDSNIQMVSNPMNKSLVEDLVKEDIVSELTRPQIETLTIICYRGPITKLELEQIRGVNCSLILRNLIVKDLIEEKVDKIVHNNSYLASLKMLKHLGINDVSELPDYDKLSTSETLDEILKNDK